ncbi:hypothetical protein QOZ80_8AG0641220 [Eleusine coracana subsp. coracana]|nr:hypothetical protein QOZ80_8AG0641220 [Eleusine coracana subsp. coracana]
MSWDDGITASSISTTPVSSGCHLLKIDRYSQTKLLLSNGKCATSCEFEAAGQPWRINYYPNGVGPHSTGHISLCIDFAGKVGTATIVVKVRFSLVPHVNGGKQQPVVVVVEPYGKSFTAYYRGCGPFYADWGVSCFIKREDLEKSEYLADDCFTIRCDIQVVKTTAVADVKVKPQDLERLALPAPATTNSASASII